MRFQNYISSIQLDNLARQLQEYLRNNKLFATVYADLHSIYVDIDTGDWKHQHLRSQFLVDDFFDEKGIIYDYMGEDVYEDTESDTYSSCHKYSKLRYRNDWEQYKKQQKQQAQKRFDALPPEEKAKYLPFQIKDDKYDKKIYKARMNQSIRRNKNMKSKLFLNEDFLNLKNVVGENDDIDAHIHLSPVMGDAIKRDRNSRRAIEKRLSERRKIADQLLKHKGKDHILEPKDDKINQSLKRKRLKESISRKKLLEYRVADRSDVFTSIYDRLFYSHMPVYSQIAPGGPLQYSYQLAVMPTVSNGMGDYDIGLDITGMGQEDKTLIKQIADQFKEYGVEYKQNEKKHLAYLKMPQDFATTNSRDIFSGQKIYIKEPQFDDDQDVEYNK